MDVVKKRKIVCEPELDMNRADGAAQGGKMRRLLQTILSLQAEAHMMGTPRRSIDREQQEFTPAYE
jgi:hypothetical protein